MTLNDVIQVLNTLQFLQSKESKPYTQIIRLLAMEATTENFHLAEQYLNYLKEQQSNEH